MESAAAIPAAAAKATVQLSGLAVIYNGNAQPVTATTTPSGLSVSITYAGSATAPTAVGSYAVVATVTSPNFTGSARGTLVISKATATVTLGNLTPTYDGAAHGATATTNPAGLTVNVIYGRSATLPVNAGSYAVTATVSDSNYKGSATGTLVIAKASATATFDPASLSATYDGKAHPAVVTATNPAGIALVLTYSGLTRGSPVNGGTYTVTPKSTNPNYNFTNTATLTITPLAATVTLGTTTVVYNGRPQAATATTVPARLPVAFTYNGSSTAPTLTGSYTLVATINSPNYTGTANGTFTITPIAPLAATAAAVPSVTSAMLNGVVNPRGTSTTVSFDFAPDSTFLPNHVYSNTVTVAQPINGSTNQTVTATTNVPLTSGVLYHFRVNAASAGGTVHGVDRVFRAVNAPIFNATAGLPRVSGSGAHVSVTVNPNGAPTIVYFKYGLTTAYGSQTGPINIGAGKTAVDVMGFLFGLQANAIYHYRLVVVSGGVTLPDDNMNNPDNTVQTLGFETSFVAGPGTPAEDSSGNLPLNGNTFNSYGFAAIDANDGIAFAARLKDGVNGINSGNDLGIWADDLTGHRFLVAQTSVTTTGLPGVVFGQFGDPVYNNQAKVAFGALLRGTGVTGYNHLAVYSNASGALSVVARQGDPAPGTLGIPSTVGTFSNFSALAISDTNTLVLATLTTSADAGVTAANNFGIWEGTTTSDLKLKLRTGNTVTVGNTTKTISALTLFSAAGIDGGQTRNFASDNGDLGVLASFTDRSTGVVLVVNGTATVVAASGGTAPGVAQNNVNGTYLQFGVPIINNSDHLAFQALLTSGVGGVTATTNVGIFADDSTGALQLIAQKGSKVPNSTGATPDATLTFVSFSNPLYNNNDEVAFAANYVLNKVSTAGIFCNNTGPVKLVAQTNDPAQDCPGCPTGTRFANFVTAALPDAVGPVFLATIKGTGVTTANNTGIWIVDATGTLQLVVRTGDQVPVVGANSAVTNKTIKSISFLPYSAFIDGQTRSFAKSGDLVYLVQFTDLTTAIYNVQFP